MLKAICIFILFLVLSSIFPAFTACSSRNPGPTLTEDSALDIHDSVRNATTIKRPKSASDIAMKWTVTEKIESMIENISYDNTTNPSPNCTQYSEPYEPHFLVQPKYVNSGRWNNTSFTENLYHFSPLFKNLTDNDVFHIHSPSELKSISDSRNRPFDHKKSTNYNFNALLNHLAKRLIGPDNLLKDVNRNKQNLMALSVAYIYTDIVRRFFRYPYEMNGVDDIIFNIIIPFRNKVHCIMHGQVRQEYCKACLNDTDMYRCCALEPYDNQTKLHGEEYIRNAAQTLHLELNRYLKAKGIDLSSINNGECFYDEFTVEMCRKIHSDLLNHEPIM